MMIGMGDDRMFYKNAIRQVLEQGMEFLLKDFCEVESKLDLELYHFFQAQRQQFVKNHVKVLKCQCKFKVVSMRTFEEKTWIDFILLYTILTENQEKMFHTEGYIPWQCEFERGILSRLYMTEYKWNQSDTIHLSQMEALNRVNETIKNVGYNREPNSERGGYDALHAVKYAERYWDDYNPAYPKFENDCTNYISQCLYAGGAQMVGSVPTSGWWMRGDTWSYSWTTAHALYLYLINSRTGLRAKEVNSQKQLLLGDVICYDFEGDGRINHTTIVVAKTVDGEPLVNAHTYNSRNRLWSYEDSSAYTSQIQYKFLQIYINL